MTSFPASTLTVPPVPVMIPGTLCGAALWGGVRLPTGARVLPAVDAGTLAGAADQVLSAVPQNQPLHLIGFSLGAIVAFEVLRAAPRRVRQLTLISANARPPTDQQRATWDEQERRTLAGEFGDVCRDAARAAGPHHAQVLEMALGVGADLFLQQLHLLRDRPDSRADLARFGGPVTLLAGDQDHVTPPVLSAELQILLPQARRTLVPGAGHYLPLCAPEVLTAALTLPEVAHA